LVVLCVMASICFVVGVYLAADLAAAIVIAGCCFVAGAFIAAMRM